jgi:proline dehydrogenase
VKLQPDHPREGEPTPPIQTAPLSALARSYLVFTACAIPALVDNTSAILDTLTHSPIPGVAELTNAVVRRTVFAQFVAGESVADCRDKMSDLRARNIGSILNYTAEAGIDAGDLTPEDLEALRFKEVAGAILEAGKFEDVEAARGATRGSTMFALKIVSGNRHRC